MKLTLSKEKTLITDVRKKHACFLGYEFRVVKGKGEHGYVTRTRPDRERLCRKVDALTDSIKKIPRETSREKLIDEINRINSQIRGVIEVKKGSAAHCQDLAGIDVHDDTADVVATESLVLLASVFVIVLVQVFLHDALNVRVQCKNEVVAVLRLDHGLFHIERVVQISVFSSDRTV